MNAFPDTLVHQPVQAAIRNVRLTRTAREISHAPTTSALILVQVDVDTVLNATHLTTSRSARVHHKWLVIRLLLADKPRRLIHAIRHHAVRTGSAESATEQQFALIQSVPQTMTAHQNEFATIKNAATLASTHAD